MRGDLATIDRLVSEGAALDAQDPDGDTPLIKAVCHGSLAAVERLLDRGAAVDARGRAGYCALHEACRLAPRRKLLERRTA